MRQTTLRMLEWRKTCNGGRSNNEAGQPHLRPLSGRTGSQGPRDIWPER